MNDIYSILNIQFNNFDSKNISRELEITLDELLQKKKKELDTIIDSIEDIKYVDDNNSYLSLVYNKFETYKQTKDIDIFTKKDLRKMVYLLNYSTEELKMKPIIYSSVACEYLLELLNINWKDKYILYILHNYLNYYKSLSNNESLQLLENILIKKLNEYNGDNIKINNLKKNQKYLNSNNGSTILGSDLFLKKISLEQMYIYLSLKEREIQYQYFSDAIIIYYQKKIQNLENLDDWESFIQELNTILSLHTFRYTQKKILVKLILLVDENKKFNLIKNTIKKLSQEQIGDVEKDKSNWQYTEEESNIESDRVEIQKARKIVHQWITQDFISIFFKECMNEPERKEFWVTICSLYSKYKNYCYSR